MTETQWWGAQLQADKAKKTDKTRTLRPDLDSYFTTRKGFKSAEPITIRLRGVFVDKCYELFHRGKNDLLIMTKSQFKGEPAVQRLHFMKKNVEDDWTGYFFNDIILSIRDFTAKKTRLDLTIQVYEINTFDKEMINTLLGLSQNIAIAFPILLPYVAIGKKSMETLITNLENFNLHTKIIDESIMLEIYDEGIGHNLLQPGYFVCFQKDLDSSTQLSLAHNQRVMIRATRKEEEEKVEEQQKEKQKGVKEGEQVEKGEETEEKVEEQQKENQEGDEGKESKREVERDQEEKQENEVLFKECSYAVFEIERQFHGDRAWEVNQKLAKLMSEVDRSKKNQTASIEFLRDTLDCYDKFRKLNRLRGLLDKKSLTAVEQELLEDLKKDEDLKPFVKLFRQ